MRHHVRHVLAYQRPTVPRWPAAVKAALATALPYLVAGAAGHLELGFLAGLGAFTVLYGQTRPQRERAVLTSCVALGIVACALLGVLLAGHAVLTVVGLGVLAVVGTYVLRRAAVGPPGIVFLVLVAGVAEQGAAHGVDRTTIVVATALGALGAVLVGLVPLGPTAPGPAPRRSPDDVPVALFAGLATLVAAALGTALGTDHPAWAAAAAALVIGAQGGRRARAYRGAQRVVGTLAGLVVFAGLHLLAREPWQAAVVVVVLQLLVELLVVRSYAAAVVLITPLALTISAASSGTRALVLVLDRAADTVIGVLVAVVVLALELAVERRAAPPRRSAA